MSSVLKALAMRRAQAELNREHPSPTLEAPENGDPIKLRLQEAIASSLTWTSRIDPSRRRILNAMVPQVIKMVASEDPVKLERFVAKTMGLCAYILEGDGAVINVAAHEMPREDESVNPSTDEPDQLRPDLATREGAGAGPGGDRDGQDDAGGDADFRLLPSLPQLPDPDPGFKAEIPG